MVAVILPLSGCNQALDEDGGFYDEKSRTYKYVKPTRRGFSKSAQQVYAPRQGETQTVTGTVASIGDDVKSVWIQIDERKPYMILATSLTGSNRDDKNKRFLLNLSYISPAGSSRGSKRFRQQWKKYATQIIGNELLNRKVLVEINYHERTRRFTGNLYQTVKTKKGSQNRDVNLWIIRQGLSYYFIDQGPSPRNKEYVQAQNLARKQKIGIWKY